MKTIHLLPILGLLIISLCSGCGVKEASGTFESVEDKKETIFASDQNEDDELCTTIQSDSDNNLEISTQEVLNYFQFIKEDPAKISRDNMRDTGIYYFDEVEITDDNNQFIYHIKRLELTEERIVEDVYFDLSIYQATVQKWWHSNIFYNEEKDIAYLVAVPRAVTFDEETGNYSSLDYVLEGWEEAKKEFVLMLVEFKVESPELYNVTVFNSPNCNSGSWFFGNYCLDNILFQNTNETEMCEFNLDTKEMYICESEVAAMEEVLEDYVPEYEKKGISIYLKQFNAVAIIDDVTIYQGAVLGRNNEDTIMCIYQAYRGRELIGTMVENEITGEFILLDD